MGPIHFEQNQTIRNRSPFKNIFVRVYRRNTYFLNYLPNKRVLVKKSLGRHHNIFLVCLHHNFIFHKKELENELTDRHEYNSR